MLCILEWFPMVINADSRIHSAIAPRSIVPSGAVENGLLSALASCRYRPAGKQVENLITRFGKSLFGESFIRLDVSLIKCPIYKE